MSKYRGRVLCLAYHFPPLVGGGMVRIHAFVKYLPRYGYLPQVLTVDPRWYNTPHLDNAPLREYASEVEIVRTSSLMPVGAVAQEIYTTAIGFSRRPLPFAGLLKPVLKVAFNLVAVPDEAILWFPYAVRAGRAIAKAWRPDLILATTPPHSVGLIAAALSRLTGVPLVLDVRDDWVGNPFYERCSRLRHRLDRVLERFAIAAARRVVAVTVESQQWLRRKYPEREPGFCMVIPNGFDPGMFTALDDAEPSPFPHPTGDRRLRVVYTGVMTRARSPQGLFEALRLMMQTRPALADDLEVIFVGNMRVEFQDMIQQMGLQSVITYGGSHAKRATMSLLRSADVGLVIIPSEEGGQTAIPSKVYEYMAVGVSVLALAEPGSALARLMRECNFGTLVPQHDPQAIATALQGLLDGAGHERLRVRLPPEVLKRFSRLEHTRQLAEVFDEIL
jgi:glycosyltransferase involved in cell wall biosynthesis